MIPNWNTRISQNLRNNPIRQDVIHIAWPVLAELLLGSLFGMIDMIMLGWIPDSAASIAAVGITNQPLLVGLSLVQALSIGATAMVARYIGAQQYDRLEDTIKHVILLNIILLGIPFSVLSILFSDSIMIFMGAQSDALVVGRIYFKIIMFGFIFQSFNFALSATLRGAGETKAPMFINLTVNFLNVLGNALLIYGLLGAPALGVTGAGISTVISQMIAGALLIIYMRKGKSLLSFDFRSGFRFNKDILYNLVKIGIPASLERLTLRLGILVFVRIVASLGTVVYAAHQICLNILGLSFHPGNAFGIAASTLLGQSLGANEPDKAQAYAKETRRIGSMISSTMALLFFIFSRQLVGLYTNNQEIIDNASVALKIIAFVQPFQSSQLILAGGLRGAGDTVWPLIASVFGILGIRILLAYIFVNVLGYGLIGAWIAVFVDQLVRWIIVYMRFLSGKWKHITIK